MKNMLLALIKKYYKLLISVTLVAALGFSLAWGLSGGYLSLEKSLYGYVGRYSYPAGVVTTEVTTSDDAAKLLALDGVQKCETRLCADTIMKTSDERFYSVRVFSYTDDETQGFYRWSEDAGENSGVLVEYNFAENNGIAPGDVLSFRVRGEYREYTVQAVVSRPETLSAKISDDAWGINYDFGYIYAPASLLREEYEKDLAEGRKELDEKFDELSDEKNSAYDLINEKRGELDDAKKLLDEKKQEYLKSEEEAKKAVSDLEKAKKELTASSRELDDKRAQLESAYATASDTLDSLTEKREKLSEAQGYLDQLDQAEAGIESKRAAMTAPDVAAAIRLLNALPGDLRMSELFDNARDLSQYFDTMEKYGFPNAGSVPVSALEQRARAFEAQLEADRAYLESQPVKELIGRFGSDLSSREEYDVLISEMERYTGAPILEDGDLTQYYKTALDNLNYLSGRYYDLEVAKTLGYLKNTDPDRSVNDMIADVLGARSRLEAIQGDADIDSLTVAETLAYYNKSLSELDNAADTVEQKRQEVLSGLESYGVDAGSLSSTMTKLDEGIASARTAMSDLTAARDEIDGGKKEIASKLEEIDKTLDEIEKKLSDGQSQIESAEKEINEGEELLLGSADGLKEFADLEKELENAYKKLGENEGYDKLCNQFLLYLDEGADADRIIASAQTALGDTAVKSSFAFDNSPVNNRIRANLDPISSLMVMLPAVFFAVVLTVVFLFMSMIINQSRRDIGVLMALGIRKSSIRALFAALGVLVSVCGIAVGCGIGVLLRRYIDGYFQKLFPLPEYQSSFNPAGFAAGAAACVAVCLAATLISTVRISRITPKEAMSRRSQSNARVSPLLDKLTRRLSPMTRFSVTSLFRSKGRFLFSAVCVAASVAFIFASVSFIKSKDRVIEETFDQRIHYDCQILLKDRPTAELIGEIGKLDGVSGAEEALIYELEISAKGSDAADDVTVYAMSPENSMIGILGPGEVTLTPESGGLIIERHTADKLNVEVGDRVVVGETEMTVAAVSDQCVNRTQYIALDDADAPGDPDLGCILCRFDGEPRQQLLALLADNESYLYSVFTDNLFSYNKQLFATYDLAAWILIAFAVLTGFIIVFNTAMTNLQDDKRELCVLRTLGFGRSEIARSRFSHSILQFVAAFAIGLVPAIYFAKASLLSISTETEEYVYASGVKEAAAVAALVFLYILISHFASMRSMKKWNPTEVIKEKE